MPNKVRARCTIQSCGAFAMTNDSRCEEHKRKAWENKSKRTRELDPLLWARARRTHVRREPSCRWCGTLDGVQVDHIVEVADGGALYDQENLQTLCEKHHLEKTAIARAVRREKEQNRRSGESWPGL